MCALAQVKEKVRDETGRDLEAIGIVSFTRIFNVVAKPNENEVQGNFRPR